MTVPPSTEERSDAVPDAAYALGLSSLPGCGQRRLHALLRLAGSGGTHREVWEDLAGGRLLGRHPAAEAAIGRGARSWIARWRGEASRIDPASAWRRMEAAGIAMVIWGDEHYPSRLRDDPEPPPLLFGSGDLDVAETSAAVAIVGTRRCTSYGADVARELGRDLAAAGVVVVSGLALGIDGAAHEGALAAIAAPDGERARAISGARPVGVVGSGLDVVYPARHRTLWRRVGERGLLLSESPPGAEPEPWRFPRRNRVLAGLADVVVVVESHANGGSMSTVRAAIDRGVPVMAVPGSVRSPSSAGTNHLLAEGVAPVTGAADVLTALALEGAHPPSSRPLAPPADASVDVGLDATDRALLRAVDWTPTSTEEILRRTGLGLAGVSRSLVALEERGLVRSQRGWWERVQATG